MYKDEIKKDNEIILTSLNQMELSAKEVDLSVCLETEEDGNIRIELKDKEGEVVYYSYYVPCIFGFIHGILYKVLTNHNNR